MANERPRTSGVKRRFCDIVTEDASADGSCSRPYKRMSPFHNTPIQKKETKRRILKISMRKMKGIDCPETFLRRSVLINNLARSLQADLKDDKIWDRWGWECDLDTFPCRPPTPQQPQHPAAQRSSPYCNPPDTSATCTLLTNAVTSSSSAINHWTLSTHANWLAGDDDAHLSPSERERVRRDLAQSHDKLAQTVEKLSTFDGELSFDSTDSAPVTAPANCETESVILSELTPQCTSNQPAPARLIVPDVCPFGPDQAQSCPDISTRRSDINRNQTSCAIYNCNSTFKHKVCAKSNSEHLPLLPSPMECSTLPSPVATCSRPTFAGERGNCPSPPSCQFSYQSSDIPATSSSQTDKVKHPGQGPHCTSYQVDTTLCACEDLSLGFFRDPATSSLGRGEFPDCFQNRLQPLTSSGDVTSSTVLTCTSTCAKSAHCDSSTVPTDGSSSAMPLTEDIWSMDDNVDQPTVTAVSGPLSPSTPSNVSCSAEADIFGADQDAFSSHGLRDFDVIYNNLVSVLIGGN